MFILASIILYTGLFFVAGAAQRRYRLFLAYGGTLFFIAVVVGGAVANVFPPFFVQGTGASPLRQLVLGATGVMFAFCSLTFMTAYLRSREPFLWWCANGLVLTTISLAGFYVQTAVGSPVGWVARFAQYISGVYFLVAIAVAGRRARKERTSLEDVVSWSLASLEEKFRAAFSNATIGFGVSNISGRVLHANPALCKLTGCSLAELRARKLSELIHPEDLADNMALVHQLLAGEIRDFTIENRYVRKDGSPVWARKSVSLVHDSRGSPQWVLALVEDITRRHEAEVKLRDSERRFRAIFNHQFQYSSLLDPGGNVVEVSESTVRATGVRREDIIDRPFIDAPWWRGLPGVREQWSRMLADAQAHPEVVRDEICYRRKDGMPRWTLNAVTALPDDRGRTEFILVEGIDITERKEAEDRLRAAQATQARDLEAMQRLQGLGTLFVRDGDFNRVLSEIVEAAIGISGADMGNVQLLDTATRKLRIVAHRGFEPDWLDYWKTVAPGQAVCGRVLANGGRVIVEDVTTSPLFVGTPALDIQLKAGVRAVQSTPMISRAGDLIGVFSTHYKKPTKPDDRALALLDLLARQAADIVERYRAEQIIRDNEALLRSVLDASVEPIYLKDRESRILIANTAALAVIGRTAEEGLGKNLDQFHDVAEEARAVNANDRKVIETAVPQVYEETFRTPEGERVFLSSKAPLRDAAGQVIGIVGVSRDITERKEQEEHVRTLMREVNHRSKNMLALVQAIAHQTTAASRDDFLTRFEDRIQSLVTAQDLVVRGDWQTVQINELVASQLLLFADLFGSRILMRGPEISLTPDAAQAIAMALHELATNAAKYGALSNAIGRIEVEWGLGKGGDGDESFEMSWIERGGAQVDKPARTGFGTSIFTSVIEMKLDAKVTISYEPVGFEWRMSCPASTVRNGRHPEAAVTGKSEGGPPTNIGAGLRILVVEDEALIAGQIAGMLKGVGYDVVGPAATVAQTLSLLEQQGCDAAVLDINLRGETSEAIADRLVASGTPFIIVSGYLRRQLPEGFGSARVLSKPIRATELQAELSRCLSGKAMQSALTIPSSSTS